MISVAMATYNGENYIREQLESIERQNKKPDEIVIVDDCSSDKTVDIIDEYAKNSSISVLLRINEVNCGYIKAFMEAVRNCSGDIIILCDQDDIWMADKTEDIIRIFTSHPDALSVHFDIDVVDNQLNTIMEGINGYEREEKYNCSKFCKKLNYSGMSTAFRNSIKEDFLSMNGNIMPTHDWIIHAIAVVNDGLYVSNKINALRRMHGNNAALKVDKTERKGIDQRLGVVINYRNYYELLQYIFQEKGLKNRKDILDTIVNYLNCTKRREVYLNKKSVVRWIKNIRWIGYYTSFKAYLCDFLYIAGVY